MDTSDWMTFQLFGHCTKYYLSNTNIPNSVPYTITFTKDVGVTFRLTSNWEEIAKVYRTGGSSFVWIMGDECLRLDDWLSHSDGGKYFKVWDQEFYWTNEGEDRHFLFDGGNPIAILDGQTLKVEQTVLGSINLFRSCLVCAILFFHRDKFDEHYNP